jgi:hypothetical protein
MYRIRHCYRSLTVVALASLLAFSGTVSPLALEKTATREVDQASTDLNTDMKVNAFTAAIEAAVNSLIAKVNTFDGRISTLETWKPVIQADVDNLKARVATLESKMDYLYNTWKPWVEGQISSLTNQYSSLNTRVTNIESKSASEVSVSAYSASANRSLGMGVHSFCALSQNYVWDTKGAVSCNCQVTKSGSSWTLTANIPSRATACSCGATCFDM